MSREYGEGVQFILFLSTLLKSRKYPENIPIFSMRWNLTVCQIIFINWEEIISVDKSRFPSNLLNVAGSKSPVYEGLKVYWLKLTGTFIAVLICQSNPVTSCSQAWELVMGHQNKKIKYSYQSVSDSDILYSCLCSRHSHALCLYFLPRQANSTGW